MAETVAAASRVTGFYRCRGILLTGASGFMGKVLAEKLLRECPDVDTVFVLFRPKHNEPTAERLAKILDSPVFDALRRARPSALSRVKAVNGDVALPGLGLSASDRERVVEAVSVVFHVAASVRFNEHLRTAFDVNVVGTREVLRLCRQMANLAALVHVSTAYSNCTRDHVEEVVYAPSMTVRALEEELAGRSDREIEEDTTRILGGYPNSYTLTKALAESLVVDEGSSLPVVIIRPSIVSPAWREPLRGWVDNINGPVGPWMAIGTGTLSCVFGDGAMVADLVPVDVCINLMLCAAWDRHANPSPGVTVYNCVSGSSNPVTWGRCTRLWVDGVLQSPYVRTLAVPAASFTRSRLYHDLRTATEKTLPAHVLDVLARLSGQAPTGLAALIRKQNRMMRPLEFFTCNEWTFSNRNVNSLWSRLNAAEKSTFDFDMGRLDWTEYMEGVLVGTKKYLLRERERTVQREPDDRRLLQRTCTLGWLFTCLSVPLPILLLAARPLFAKL